MTNFLNGFFICYFYFTNQRTVMIVLIVSWSISFLAGLIAKVLESIEEQQDKEIYTKFKQRFESKYRKISTFDELQNQFMKDKYYVVPVQEYAALFDTFKETYQRIKDKENDK